MSLEWLPWSWRRGITAGHIKPSWRRWSHLRWGRAGEATSARSINGGWCRRRAHADTTCGWASRWRCWAAAKSERAGRRCRAAASTATAAATAADGGDPFFFLAATCLDISGAPNRRRGGCELQMDERTGGCDDRIEVQMDLDWGTQIGEMDLGVGDGFGAENSCAPKTAWVWPSAAARAGSERAIGSGRRGRTTEAASSPPSWSTGQGRRLARRRGARLSTGMGGFLKKTITETGKRHPLYVP